MVPKKWLPHAGAYKSWRKMLARVDGASAHNSHRYSGRGISVCAEWRSFENFLRDMGDRPDGMTLDRVDNNNAYAPSNCRWSSPKAQSRNRSTNKLNHELASALRADRAAGASYKELGQKYGISTPAARLVAIGAFWASAPDSLQRWHLPEATAHIELRRATVACPLFGRNHYRHA